MVGGSSRIAAEYYVHVAAARVAMLEEADEVAAVLPDRVDVLIVAADLAVEGVRHPGRAVDRRLDAVGEPLPAVCPGRRAGPRGGGASRERHDPDQSTQ